MNGKQNQESPMRILMVHNLYQQRGGEDISTEQDVELLQSHGHEVQTYFRNNEEIRQYSLLKKASLFFRPAWSWQAYRQIRRILKTFQPDVVHVQNFFPLISPAVFYACHSLKIPVVFSLRNYRLACANSYFYRDNMVCEDCIRHSALHGMVHKCYHRSLVQTASVAMMQVTHRWLKTWEKKIDVIAPVSKFAAGKMLDMGLGSENTLVRKNYLMQDPGEGHESRTGAVFVGRLSPEKGTDTLIRAWQQLPHVPLQIIGTGPEEANLQQGMAGNAEVIFCGHLPHGEMLKRIKSAQVLVMPSVWYETFGRTIIEAYATATPVIVSRLGAMTELVDEGKTGLLFDPGDADDLVQKVTWAMNHPQETAEMGIQARRVFLEKFSADNAYHRLMEVYQVAVMKKATNAQTLCQS